MHAHTIARQYLSGAASMPTEREAAAFTEWLRISYGPIAPMVCRTHQEVTPEDFMAAWLSTGKLLISDAHSEHPFLTVDQNVMFRAVHDWHHLQTGCEFDWQGEVAAFELAAELAPRCIHWMLRSEILGQAAAAIITGQFPAQKLVRTVWG